MNDLSKQGEQENPEVKVETLPLYVDTMRQDDDEVLSISSVTTNNLVSNNESTTTTTSNLEQRVPEKILIDFKMDDQLYFVMKWKNCTENSSSKLFILF